MWRAIKRWITTWIGGSPDLCEDTSASQSVQEKETIRVRLSHEQYAVLAKTVHHVGVPKTPEEAAFMCGANTVLEKLREGWVIQRE